jgi:hypothetical protein
MGLEVTAPPRRKKTSCHPVRQTARKSLYVAWVESLGTACSPEQKRNNHWRLRFETRLMRFVSFYARGSLSGQSVPFDKRKPWANSSREERERERERERAVGQLHQPGTCRRESVCEREAQQTTAIRVHIPSRVRSDR